MIKIFKTTHILIETANEHELWTVDPVWRKLWINTAACTHTHTHVILPNSIIPNSESTLFSCCCSAVQLPDADKDEHRAWQDVFDTCITTPLQHYSLSPLNSLPPLHPLLIALHSDLLPHSCPLTILFLNSSLSPPTARPIFPSLLDRLIQLVNSSLQS